MNSKKKRFFAILGLIALFLLIISFILSAFIGSVRIFQGLLFCIWAVPILLWVCIGLYGHIANKRTIADLFPETDEERKLKEEAYLFSLQQTKNSENTQKEESDENN